VSPLRACCTQPMAQSHLQPQGPNSAAPHRRRSSRAVGHMWYVVGVASIPSQRRRCVCADDIEAALPPAKEVAELPSPREPRRPTMDDLSSTDDEADEAPAMPLQSVLVQVLVITFIHLPIDVPVSTDFSRT